MGTAVTLRQPIGANRVETDLENVEAYAVAGTPADCVILGVRLLFPGGLDLVVSGINRGPNIGYDNFVSGTVGAAVQGYLHGISSMAISVDGYEDMEFNAAARLGYLLVDRISYGALPKEMLLSINLPNLPTNRLEGVEVTSLSKRSYCNAVEENCGCDETCYRILRSQDARDSMPGTDTWALLSNRISITPLLNKSSIDLFVAHLRDLLPAVYDELCAL